MAAPAGSLVAAVLASSGRLDKEDLGTRIGRLSRRVEELKAGPGAGVGEAWGEPGGGAGCPGPGAELRPLCAAVPRQLVEPRLPRALEGPLSAASRERRVPALPLCRREKCAP